VTSGDSHVVLRRRPPGVTPPGPAPAGGPIAAAAGRPTDSEPEATAARRRPGNLNAQLECRGPAGRHPKTRMMMMMMMMIIIVTTMIYYYDYQCN
jgi:hypothetical protein